MPISVIFATIIGFVARRMLFSDNPDIADVGQYIIIGLIIIAIISALLK